MESVLLGRRELTERAIVDAIVDNATGRDRLAEIGLHQCDDPPVDSKYCDMSITSASANLDSALFTGAEVYAETYGRWRESDE